MIRIAVYFVLIHNYTVTASSATWSRRNGLKYLIPLDVPASFLILMRQYKGSPWCLATEEWKTPYRCTQCLQVFCNPKALLSMFLLLGTPIRSSVLLHIRTGSIQEVLDYEFTRSAFLGTLEFSSVYITQEIQAARIEMKKCKGDGFWDQCGYNTQNPMWTDSKRKNSV